VTIRVISVSKLYNSEVQRIDDPLEWASNGKLIDEV